MQSIVVLFTNVLRSPVIFRVSIGIQVFEARNIIYHTPQEKSKVILKYLAQFGRLCFKNMYPTKF